VIPSPSDPCTKFSLAIGRQTASGRRSLMLRINLGLRDRLGQGQEESFSIFLMSMRAGVVAIGHC